MSADALGDDFEYLSELEDDQTQALLSPILEEDEEAAELNQEDIQNFTFENNTDDENQHENTNEIETINHVEGENKEKKEKELTAERKLKRKQREKERKAKKVKLQREQLSQVPSHPRDIIQFLWTEFINFKKKTLSSLEISELESKYALSASHAVDASSFEKEHADSQFEEFIKEMVPEWERLFSTKKNGKKGKPVMVIVCSSAIRCVNVIKLLPQLHQLCRIGKMFTKHMKIEDQIAYLKEKMVRIVVGTPSRLASLQEDTGFMKDCHYVLMDMSLDKKERNLFTVPECKRDLFDQFMPFVFDLMVAQQAKVMFF